MNKLLISAIFLLCGSALQAAEADHFTLEDGQMVDITEPVNRLANEGLQAAIDDLNAQGGCDDTRAAEERLYERLTDVFSNHKKGQLVQAILHGDLPRTVIPLKESLYGEWSIWNGFLLGRKGAAKSPLALSPLIKIGDTVIGADKLEHMFGMGLRYFNKHYLEDRPLVSVLKNGIFKEKTALGGNMLATGVFSYADLSANFNGMRFWNHMLQKRDDVLGARHNIGPYLTCQAGKWTKNPERPIDFRNYVDVTMQESMNCSKFATNGGVKKFQEALIKMQNRDKSRTFSCPVSPRALNEVARKYEVEIAGDSRGSKIDHWIINRDGNEKVSYFNEF
ncbi:MAG: hypothetical protein A2179_03340 [Elusimicrobia bacterium GWC2_63_65]|nr:MAG: hypothetical protein A2179_03340 [Elusimicrobia bacterium GWC2_63_65]